MSNKCLNYQVYTFPRGSIVQPLSNIDVAISMDQSSVPMRDVIFPVALVDGAISPLLHSSPISFIILPLSLINIFLFELYGAQILSIIDF